jgi:KRAB domain-containing zinc finger protein
LLTNHLKYIHLGVQPDRPFLCIDCGKDFVRRDHLQRHRKNVHGTGPMAASANAPAPVNNTPIVTAPATTTVQHVTITPERPKRRFLCVICGKDFNRKDHLQRHQKNVHHQGQNPSVAVEVGPSATADATLAPHQATMSIAN